MSLFFKPGTIDRGILSLTPPAVGDPDGGSVSSSLINKTKDVEYTFPKRTQTVVTKGQSSIQLNMTLSGQFDITPAILLRTTVPPVAPSTIPTYTYRNITATFGKVRTLDSGLVNSSTRASANESITISFILEKAYSLETEDLVLRMTMTDSQTIRPSPDSASSLTFHNTSYLDMRIRAGESQKIDLWSQAIFRNFRKQEKMFLWSSVVARQRQTINPKFIVINKESVSHSIYTNTNPKEVVSLEYGTTVNVYTPFSDNAPYLDNIDLGDYAVVSKTPNNFQEKFSLRKKESLDTIVDNLSYPELLVPPKSPEIIYPDRSLSNAANKFVEAFEMIKVAGDDRVDAKYNEIADIFRIPGGLFRVLMPKYEPLPSGADSVVYVPGTTTNPIREWRLPTNFGTQFYRLPLSFFPRTAQPNIDQNDHYLTVAPSLWLVLRQKSIGATVGAFYNGQPGKKVLHRAITSRDEVSVWTWENVTSTVRTNGTTTIRVFEADLFISNDTLRAPGFQGSSAAMMIA